MDTVRLVTVGLAWSGMIATFIQLIVLAIRNRRQVPATPGLIVSAAIGVFALLVHHFLQ